MANEQRHTPSIHATAVAIDGRALLIVGPSRAGKSRLALALIAASTARRPIILVGDDRIVLTEANGQLLAHPHPRIAGFIERRGLGIVACPYKDEALVAARVDLGPHSFIDRRLENFPQLGLVDRDDTVSAALPEQADIVLAWWSRLPDSATSRPQCDAKALPVRAGPRKD